MAGLTSEQNALLAMLLQAVDREQQVQANPFVAARIKEDELIQEKGQQNGDIIQNSVVRVDRDGDVLILFETVERRYCFIVILESSDGTIGWRESQLLKVLFEFSCRGNLCNNELFLEISQTLKNKFQAVEFGLNADRRLACKVKPGAGGLADINGKIIRSSILFDEEKNEFTFLMFVAPPAAEQATRPPSVYAFNIELLHKQNQLGIAESKALAHCVSFAEPGDEMNDVRFHACCGIMQKLYNQAALVEQSMQGLPVKICVIRPTLLNRTEPIDPRFQQALDMVELQGLLAMAARLGVAGTAGAPPASTASTGSTGSAAPDSCEYPGVTKGALVADSGQATVYRGKYENKDVAIKIFKGDRQALAAYKDELKALLKLGAHKNVISILDFFETPRPCIIMRYIEGGSLWDAIETHGAARPFSLSESLHIAQGIADGIAHLHSNGVLHRDLKSTNILLDTKNEPVIIDLGLGKRFEGLGVQHTKATKGSFFWIAPEMCEKGEYSDKNDIFALGIILYEVFATAHPYNQQDIPSEHSFLRSVADGSLRPNLSKLPKTTPDWMKKLMQDCWASNPLDRPSISYVQRVIQSKGADAKSPKEVFVQFAGGIDKELNKASFSKCLGALAPQTTPKERELLFEVMDKDKSGTVDWNEFRECWAIVEQKGIDFAISMKDKGVPDHQVMTHIEPDGQRARAPSTVLEPPAARPNLLRAMSSGRMLAQQSSARGLNAVPRPKTVADVLEWCSVNGLDSLVETFKKEEIDGDGLNSLNDMNLTEIQDFLGNPNIPRGHILKLRTKLKELYA